MGRAQIYRRWIILLVLTVGLSGLMAALHVPAAPLLAAIVASVVAGKGLKLPAIIFRAAQAVLGAMIGLALTQDLFAAFLARWPLVLCVVVVTVGISLVLGLGLYRLRLVDKATALWASLPAAASSMIALSAGSGADVGLVAFIQYFRVLSIAVVAALAGGALAVEGVVHVGPETPQSVLATLTALAIIALMTWLASRYRIIGIALLGTAAIVGAATLSGLIDITMPSYLLIGSYWVIGWYVGLSVDKDTLARLGRLVGPVFLSTLVLLTLCGGIAWLLVIWFGVAPNTAFLATIPGGLDAVAIIAATTGADIGFVMLFQTVRFLLVVLIGIPLISRLIRISHKSP